MGRGTQTEAGTGTSLLYGAPARRGISPVDRVRDLAIRRPDVAWTYLLDLMTHQKLSREEEREALRAIAAADVERLYAGIGSVPEIAHISQEAWDEEREFLEKTWPGHLRPSAANGSAKPEDPEDLVFHRPTLGNEGFGPLAVLSMPSPTDEWLLGLSVRRRQAIASCLSGNLEKTPLGAFTRRRLVEYILDAKELRSASARGVAGRLVWAEQIFGQKQIAEFGDRETADLETGVAQDLMLSIRSVRESWAEARERVARGDGGRAASEIFIRRVMRLIDDVEPGHVYAAFTPEQRRAIGETLFTARTDEFRPFFMGLRLELEERLGGSWPWVRYGPARRRTP